MKFKCIKTFTAVVDGRKVEIVEGNEYEGTLKGSNVVISDVNFPLSVLEEIKVEKKVKKSYKKEEEITE